MRVIRGETRAEERRKTCQGREEREESHWKKLRETLHNGRRSEKGLTGEESEGLYDGTTLRDEESV